MVKNFLDDDRKFIGQSTDERLQSQTLSERKTLLTPQKQRFRNMVPERFRPQFESSDKVSNDLKQAATPKGKADANEEDSFMVSPEGLISVSTPTDSKNGNKVDLSLKKQTTSENVRRDVAAKLFGTLLFTTSLFLYSFQTLMIKIVQQNNGISPQELLYYFSIVTCVLSIGTTKVYKEDLKQLKPETYKAVIGRFVMGYFSDIFLFVAYVYTSYSKCQCLFFTNTLMIPFFAKFILNENIKKVDIVAIILSFMGMLLIIQPFKGSQEATQDMQQELTGVGMALVAAATGALSMVYNKKASAKVHHSKMTTYYTMANVLFSPIWSFFQPRETYPVYDGVLIMYILGIGITFWAMQMCMTKAFSLITAGMASILIYIAVPIGYILDYLFLGTQIGNLEIIGVCVIVGTNVVIGLLLYFGVIR